MQESGPSPCVRRGHSTRLTPCVSIVLIPSKVINCASCQETVQSQISRVWYLPLVWYGFASKGTVATVPARRTTVNRITSLKLAAAWGIAQKFYTPGASRNSKLQSVLVPKCLPTLSHEVAVLATCFVDLRSSQHTGRAADVLGLDVSVAQLAESRRRVPGAEFDFLVPQPVPACWSLDRAC